jgi:hypothetical protein
MHILHLIAYHFDQISFIITELQTILLTAELRCKHMEFVCNSTLEIVCSHGTILNL